MTAKGKRRAGMAAVGWRESQKNDRDQVSQRRGESGVNTTQKETKDGQRTSARNTSKETPRSFFVTTVSSPKF